MARKPLSARDKAERNLARQLNFHSGVRGQRELHNFIAKVTSLPRNDRRYVPPELVNDLHSLKVARALDRRHMTPTQTMLQKQRALVVEPEGRNHMSAGAFRDRYKDAILALLNSAPSDYQRRQLRRLQRDLNQRINAGDDAPLPAHIAANDRRRAADTAAREAEKIAAPFREKEKQRRERAQAKERAARERKYGKKSSTKRTGGHSKKTRKRRGR